MKQKEWTDINKANFNDSNKEFIKKIRMRLKKMNN